MSRKIGNPMSFDDHDYSVIAKALKLRSLQSLHMYHDLYLVKRIQLNLINSEDVKLVFGSRSLSHHLRLAKDLKM